MITEFWNNTWTAIKTFWPGITIRNMALYVATYKYYTSKKLACLVIAFFGVVVSSSLGDGLGNTLMIVNVKFIGLPQIVATLIIAAFGYLLGASIIGIVDTANFYIYNMNLWFEDTRPNSLRFLTLGTSMGTFVGSILPTLSAPNIATVWIVSWIVFVLAIFIVWLRA